MLLTAALLGLSMVAVALLSVMAVGCNNSRDLGSRIEVLHLFD